MPNIALIAGNLVSDSGLDSSAINAQNYSRKHSARDFPNGTLIETTIDYSVTNGDPFVLEITGNSYGALVPFNMAYQGYIYNNTTINHGGISTGAAITGMSLFNYNGKLCFWFPSQGYWQGFNVYVYIANTGFRENKVTNITNVAKPAGITKEISMTFQHLIRAASASVGTTNYVAKFTGNVAVGDSQIFDNGTIVGVAATSAYIDSNDKLVVNGGRFAVVGGAYSAAAFNRSNAGVITLYLTGGIGRGQMVSDGTNFGVEALQALYFNSGSAERMRITNAGNVGIGTASPSIYGGWTGLDIRGTNGGHLIVGNTAATNRGEIFTDGNGFNISAQTNNALIVKTNDTERMRITSAGNVGIGTTSPTYGLTVEGSTANSGTGTTLIKAQLNSSGKGLVIDSNTRTSADNAVLALEIINRAGGNTLAATVAGNVGIGTTSPGSRLTVQGTIQATNGSDSDSGNFTGLIIGSVATNNARTASIIKGTSGPYDLIIRSQNNSSVVSGAIIFQNGSTEMLRIGENSVVTVANLAGTGTRIVVADSLGGLSATTLSSSIVGGSGSSNILTKWTGTNTIGNSSVFDNGTILSTTTSLVLNPSTAGSSYLQFKYNLTDVGLLGSTASITGTTPGDLSVYVYGDNNLDMWTNNSRRLRIFGSGRIGVNTTTDAGYQFDVSGTLRTTGSVDLATSGGEVRIGMSDAGNYVLQVGGPTYLVGAANTSLTTSAGLHYIAKGDNTYFSGFNFQGVAASDMFFGRAASSDDLIISTSNIAGAVERVRFRQNGNVGVGTANPLSRMHIAGAGGSTGVRLTLSNGGDVSALNDPLGVIDFYSDDASGGLQGIKGYLGVYNEFNGNWDGSTSRYDTYMAFGTSLDNAMSERMRITSAGNVGIGTTSPAARLDVFTTSTNGIDLRNAPTTLGDQTSKNSPRLRLVSSRYEGGNVDAPFSLQNVRTGSPTNDQRLAITNFGDVEVMSITNLGNVGITQNNPTSRLTISASGTGSTAHGIRLDAGAQQHFWYLEDNVTSGYNIGSSAGNWKWSNSNGTLMMLNASGNLGVGSTNPLNRLHVEFTNATAYTPSNTLTAPPIAYFYNNSSADAAVASTIRLDAGNLTGNNATSISAVRTGNADSALTFGTRSGGGTVTERVRITSTGDVGIGTVSPAYKLDVNGGTRVTGRLTITGNDTLAQSMARAGTSAFASQIYNSGGDNSWLLWGVESSLGGVIFPGSTAYAAVIGQFRNTPLEFFTNNTIRGSFSGAGAFRVHNLAGDGSRIVVADANGVLSTTATAPITGTGTVNYIPKFTAGSTIGNSQIFDNGTNVGIGTSSPSYKTHIKSTRNTSGLQIEMSDRNTLNDYTQIGFSFDPFPTTITSAIRSTFTSPFTSFETNLSFHTYGTSLSERLRIFANGRIGINTTTDAGYQLDINGTLRSVNGANFATTSGNVGIGTASPAYKLDVNGNIAANSGSLYSIAPLYPQLILTETTGSSNSVIFYDGGASPKALRFRVAGSTDFMSITSAGELLVNTTSDAGDYKLQVAGGIYVTGNAANAAIQIQSGQAIRTNGSAYFDIGTSGSGIFNLRAGSLGNNAMYVHNNGRVGFNTNVDNGYLVDVFGTFRTTNGANFATASGNVGIGTTSATSKLEVNTTVNAIKSTTTNGEILLREGGSNATYNTVELHVRPSAGKSGYLTFTENAVDDRWAIGIANGNGSLRFLKGSFLGTLMMQLNSSGELLLNSDGTDAGDYKLQVSGNIYNTGSAVLAATSGNVGIGTASPSGFSDKIVNIYGSTSAELHLTTAGTGTLNNDGFVVSVRDSDGLAQVIQRENAALLFGTNDTERLRISSAGVVTVANLAGSGARVVIADASGNLSATTLSSSVTTGSGTTNYIPKWTSANAIGDSVISNVGGLVGINTASPVEMLSLSGGTGVTFGVSLNPSGWNNAKHRYTVPSSGDEGVLSYNYNGSAVDYTGYATSSIAVGNGVLKFSTGGINTAPLERVRIFANGRVFIGDSPIDAGYRLDVSGTLRSAGGFTLGLNGADSYAFLSGYNNGQTRILSNPGFGSNYNGTQIESNYTNANTLPAWALDLGGVNGALNGADKFAIGRKPSGGSYSSFFYINGSGNVGIGTTTPIVKLDVNGSGVFRNITYIGRDSAANDANVITLRQTAGTDATLGTLYFNTELRPSATGANRRVDIYAGDNIGYRNINFPYGNIGIGTTSPGSKLDVVGDITATTGFVTSYRASGESQIRVALLTNQMYMFNNSTSYGLYGSDYGGLFSRNKSTGLLNIYDKAYITSGGNVGIGTDSPSHRLTLARSGTAPSFISFRNGNTTSGDITIGASAGGDLYITNPNSTSISFFTSSSNPMNLTSGGSVLIGTVSDLGASYRLQVTGNTYQTGYAQINGVSNFPSLYVSSHIITGSSSQAVLSLGATLNTTGAPSIIYADISDTASGAETNFMQFVNGSTKFRVTKQGDIQTAAPAGGTAKKWKLGSVVTTTVIMVTSQYVEVEIDGTFYRLALVSPA